MPADTSRDPDNARNDEGRPVASLLFAPGRRPDSDMIADAAGRGDAFGISLNPADDSGKVSMADRGFAAGEERWVELIANGMTFDLSGLAPGPPARPPHGNLAPALARMDDAPDVEAVSLRPGPHLAGGGGMVPVIRCLALLTAQLAELPALRAVAWHPAGHWASPEHFRSSVLRWIDGGVFPGLALASLLPLGDGGMQSRGLALFTGQELQLRPGLAGDAPAMAKLALRLMHWLVGRGGVAQVEQVVGPDGEDLIVEPGPGHLLIVRPA